MKDNYETKQTKSGDYKNNNIINNIVDENFRSVTKSNEGLQSSNFKFPANKNLNSNYNLKKKLDVAYSDLKYLKNAMRDIKNSRNLLCKNITEYTETVYESNLNEKEKMDHDENKLNYGYQHTGNLSTNDHYNTFPTLTCEKQLTESNRKNSIQGEMKIKAVEVINNFKEVLKDSEKYTNHLAKPKSNKITFSSRRNEVEISKMENKGLNNSNLRLRNQIGSLQKELEIIKKNTSFFSNNIPKDHIHNYSQISQDLHKIVEHLHLNENNLQIKNDMNTNLDSVQHIIMENTKLKNENKQLISKLNEKDKIIMEDIEQINILIAKKESKIKNLHSNVNKNNNKDSIEYKESYNENPKVKDGKTPFKAEDFVIEQLYSELFVSKNINDQILNDDSKILAEENREKNIKEIQNNYQHILKELNKTNNQILLYRNSPCKEKRLNLISTIEALDKIKEEIIQNNKEIENELNQNRNSMNHIQSEYQKLSQKYYNQQNSLIKLIQDQNIQEISNKLNEINKQDDNSPTCETAINLNNENEMMNEIKIEPEGGQLNLLENNYQQPFNEPNLNNLNKVNTQDIMGVENVNNDSKEINPLNASTSKIETPPFINKDFFAQSDTTNLKNSTNLTSTQLPKLALIAQKTPMNPITDAMKSEREGITNLLSIYDNMRVLSYDLFTKQFDIISIIDETSFINLYNKENTLTTNTKEGLFIITGSNTDSFFFFNKSTNRMTKLKNLNHSHANGSLLYFYKNNYLICLSGKKTKKVEKYVNDDCLKGGNKLNINKNKLLKKDNWVYLPHMISDRSNAGYIIINDKYLYSLFGYSYIKNIYLDTIERLDLEQDYFGSNFEWEEVKYCNDDNTISTSIKSFYCIQCTQQDEILIMGGYNGANQTENKTIMRYNYKQNLMGLFTDKTLPDNYNYYGFERENIPILIIDEMNKGWYALFDDSFKLHVLENETLQYDIINFSY